MTARKKIKYIVQSWFLYLIFLISKALGYKNASHLGGWLGRTIGTRMGASKKAKKNLSFAFPEKTTEEINTLVTGMWDNLGRVIFEYPHIEKIKEHTVIKTHGFHHFKEAQKQKKPILMLSAHLGNWEIIPFIINSDPKRIMSSVYRPPNNPWADKILVNIRKKAGGKQIKKGSQGAKEIIKLIKEGEDVGFLFDQKMNEGIPIPFFGRLAMTVTSVAQLGLKYDCTIFLVHSIRKNKTEFDVFCSEPFELTRTGNLSKDIESNMRRLNNILEGWILEAPEQWLWLHRRWPESQTNLKQKKKKKVA